MWKRKGERAAQRRFIKPDGTRKGKGGKNARTDPSPMSQRLSANLDLLDVCIMSRGESIGYKIVHINFNQGHKLLPSD